MTITKTVKYQFMAYHFEPGLPTWHHCHRGHGPTFRVWFELACAREDLPENGLLGDPETLLDLDNWIEDTLAHRFGERSLNDLVPDGKVDSLARWIWGQWRERIPELKAVVVDESVGVMADWPDGSSTTAPQLRRRR